MALAYYDIEQPLYPVKGAWALRKVVSTYTGALIRVRDGFDNSEQDVGFDGDGRLNTFTVVGTAYVTRVYDQSGNGNHLGQTTTSKQPVLVLGATPAGYPAIKFDGVDDYLVDQSPASTSLAYLVTYPMLYFTGGGGSPRSSFATVVGIPHIDGANTSPYFRMSLTGPTGTSDSLTMDTRLNTSNNTGLFMSPFNTNSGWGGFVFVPNKNALVRPVFAFHSISGGSSGITYPNNTRLRIGADGAGGGNWGGYFTECVILSGAPSDAYNMRPTLYRAIYDGILGRNGYWRIDCTAAWNGTVQGGFAEIELANYAGGPDMLSPSSKAGADRRYDAAQSWDNVLDDNASSWWATTTTGSYPVITFYKSGDDRVEELRVKLRNDASYNTQTSKFTISRYTEDGWEVSPVIDLTTEGSSSGQSYTRALTWAADPFTVEWSFDYAIDQRPPISGEWLFDYEIQGVEPVTDEWVFGYEVFGPISGSWSFSYEIYLAHVWRFSYDMDAKYGNFMDYAHIYGGITPTQKIAPTLSRNASQVNDASVVIHGGVTDIQIHVLDDFDTVRHMHFYADYYERVWVSPSQYRLSNPRIGYGYPFYVWNAFSKNNSMIDFYPVDLTGVDFTEEGDISIAFSAFQQRELHFTIEPDTPAEIDGTFNFTFTYDTGSFDLYALVLGVLRTIPNEPLVEVWSWYTLIETSRNGTEQRQARRSEPRTLLSYDVVLADEDDRISAYQQFYAFASRSVLVPMFQYSVLLDANASAGDTRLYFDLAQSDIRADEYLVFYNNATELFEIAQVLSLHTDGVELYAPLTLDLDENWNILPSRSMRLPNGSSMALGALTGQASFRGESNGFRALLRENSSATLEEYDGFKVLAHRPIAQDDINETFVSDVDVIDNEKSMPIQKSSYTNPFITSEKSWLIERETDMDWWRAFFNYTKGQLRSFLMPTWRFDLPLGQELNLGDIDIYTTNLDFLDYFAHATYAYVMILSDAGVIYRKVNDAVVENGLLRVTLDDNITSTPGANTGVMVSFMNLVRLEDDEVTLNHFAEFTILTLNTRTVNQ